MISAIFIVSTVALLLLVWFNSDAFVEYATIVGGRKFFHIDKYEKAQKKKATLDYLGYISERHDSFFIRLITCPLCFSIWITMFVTFLATNSLFLFPPCNILALVTYKLTSNLLES